VALAMRSLGVAKRVAVTTTVSSAKALVVCKAMKSTRKRIGASLSPEGITIMIAKQSRLGAGFRTQGSSLLFAASQTLQSSAICEFRSLLPLRDSLGFAPNSLLRHAI
jgi:hypothetical protein